MTYVLQSILWRPATASGAGFIGTLNARVAFVGIVLVAVATLIAQSSVSGMWSSEVQGRRGQQQVTITLKAHSGKLTGTVTGGRGGGHHDRRGHHLGRDTSSSRRSRWAGAARSFWTGRARRASKSRSSAQRKVAGVRARTLSSSAALSRSAYSARDRKALGRTTRWRSGNA